VTRTRSRRGTHLLLAALAALAQGCAGCDTLPDGALTSCEQSVTTPGVVQTDILFVIDDSGSMAGEQANLKAGLQGFLAVLQGAAVQDQFQIGVTTTSVVGYVAGDTAYSRTRPGNTAPTPYPAGILVAVDPAGTNKDGDPTQAAVYNTWGNFLWTDDPGAADPGFYGPRILRWDSPTLQTDFEYNVLVGVDGSGREMPFEAAMRALGVHAAPGQENASFRRPGARLAVVFLSDEDDCSGPVDATITSNGDCQAARTVPGKLIDVASVADFLRSRGAVVGAIVGVTCTGGVCTNTLCSGATATPNRFLELQSLLDPEKTRLASICDSTFDAALADIATAIVSRTVPLEGEPADWRMLVVGVVKADGSRASCSLAESGSPEAATADVVYSPGVGGEPASLHFQDSGACRLDRNYKVEIDVICAG
jgi:hypothetical protein